MLKKNANLKQTVRRLIFGVINSETCLDATPQNKI